MNELNRLVQRGLPVSVACEVADGKLDEEFEVSKWTACSAAVGWAGRPENRTLPLTPRWDCDPSRYYLSMDGESPATFDGNDLVIVEVAVEEVVARLHSLSTRNKGPWDSEYEKKTARTAYRWAHGLAVTPPFISVHGDAVTIQGGMHRFHLAVHHAAARLPCLVRSSDLTRLQSLLPSALATD